MDELQGCANTFAKPYLYQKYGHPSPLPGQPTTTPASPAAPIPHNVHTATETDEDKEVRLYKLFNKWVPRGDDFYNMYPTLGLSHEEVVAIQNEIVNYRVKTALAASKRTTYRAPWETAPQYLPGTAHAPKQQGSARGQQNEGDAMDADPDDPFGLGLTSLPVAKGKGRASDIMDLLD